ncbi:tail fiber domain-containing protein [Serratia rubidaea]|uniref:tail fiber domain-containing protein n=1 Tax=Serratia rubidaea TaxID=61652 RepID=UPI003FA3D14E
MTEQHKNAQTLNADGMTQPAGETLHEITWLKPEDFGGGPDVADNGPAFRAMAQLAESNNAAACIRLGARTYRVKTPVAFNCAVIIEGVGATHAGLAANTVNESDRVQRCSSIIKDARDYDTDEYLFTFNDRKPTVLGITLRNLEFVGAHVSDSPKRYKTCGVFVDISGWVSSSINVILRDFGLTGLKINHNDGIWNNISLLRCGGKLNGDVYYALDLKRENDIGSFTNQHKFNNPHIEHCRYAIRCSGYMNLFFGGHLEINDWSFTPDGDSYPVVLFEQLTYPVTFDKMTFISTDTLRYLDGYPLTTDPEQLAANLASVPYFFGGVPGRMIDPTSDVVKAFVRFSGCDFTHASKPVLWLDIPDVRTYLDGVHITRAATWAPAIKLGQDSRITNSFIQMAAIKGNTSNYADLVNNVYSVPVAGYGHISADGVQFYGGHPAYAAFSAGNSGGGSARSRITNVIRGAYGATIGNALGDYIGGYLSSYDGVRIQSHDGASHAAISHDRMTSTTGAFTIGSARYTASRVGVIANLDGAGNFLAPTANDRNWLGSRAAANSWNGVFTKAFFMGAASPDGYWPAGLYPTAPATYSIGSSALPVKNIYLQNPPVVICDTTHKTEVRSVEDLLLDAVGSVAFCAYKMKNAVAKKGSKNARYHIGVLAQDVRDAITAVGLDWRQYALIAYEEAEIEIARDDHGNLIPLSPEQTLIATDKNGHVHIESEQDRVVEKEGKRLFVRGTYMLRMEEFLALRMAYIERKLLNND